MDKARRAKVVLSCCLASWLGLFPVFQATHLALSNHDHFFCYRHLRIEDAPRLDAAERFARQHVAAEAQDSRRVLHFQRDACEVATPADLLLSFCLQDHPPLKSGQAAEPLTDNFSLLRSIAPAGAVLSRPLILVAPKTSPPKNGHC